jgi:Flp pilus assembly pilin Flp
MVRIKMFTRDRRGATLVEYALLAALVVLAAIGPFLLMVGTVREMFELVASSFPG